MSEFPSGFTWGVSTAAYQIEGAAGDGKAPSIWDVFAHLPGRIRDGSDGDVACDHLARMDEDLDLLADLGVGAYRFSTSWTRILPRGGGRVRARGLDAYERLTDGLVERGIEPWLCLYHWDLPWALQERGGWASRDTAHYFADYAAVVAERLGDRVDHFLMLNEPNVHAMRGHLLGTHAPGLADPAAFAAALHHQNLATGMGVARLREIEPSWRLGTVVNLQPVVAADDGDRAARAAELVDALWNRCALDPLLLGRYPDVAAPALGGHDREDDLALIRQPLDVLGVNYYTRTWARASDRSPLGFELVEPPPGTEITAMGWEVVPEALTRLLIELKESYGNPPVAITENGAAFDDGVPGTDAVEDVPRARYLARHLRAVQRAVQEGCDVQGYFLWTLVDNFEWAEGFTRRFGIVRLDRGTQRRTPKLSYRAYRDIVRSGSLDDVEERLAAREP